MILDPNRAQNIMGTAVMIHATGPASVIDEAFAHMRWVDETFSTFRPESQISQIGSGRLAVEDAHPAVAEVLAKCAWLEEATDGAFSHQRRGRLDPAGYVKGWAVDGSARLLRKGGIDDFLIWAGGDVLAAGRSPEGVGWRVGIRDPQDAGVAIDEVRVSNAAVATSGAYERGNHIERRGKARLLSASVIGPHLGVADSLATALFAVGLEDAGWLREFPDYGFIVLTEDRRVLRSSPRSDPA